MKKKTGDIDFIYRVILFDEVIKSNNSNFLYDIITFELCFW